MIALIQRVNHATIHIAGNEHAAIRRGLLAFVGIEREDTERSADRILERLLAYRVFPDAEGKMNQSLKDTGGDLMLVSQFTLAASTNSGLRPSFSSAMPPVGAGVLYQYLLERAAESHASVASGVFAADMQITLENDGPVTFILKG